ncbi:Acyl-coenzyme A thioesterase THEM4 [Madurella mycetomatis]|uniref:Acyl-coenzyme A thioesterase THEM4 n=1 Tax=Madurella mycetomatis TaxID=100816 RepID=A0A175W2Z9_9PEZI|nr:Acyl-coenzyme A thioesterase THEM4 [Madurella mycetomatis]
MSHKHNNKEANLQESNEMVSARQVDFFRAIPWCAAHLSPSPSLRIAQSVTRERKPEGSTLDTLISQTLNRPDAMPAYITFYSAPPGPRELVTEVRAFFALGPMVNGWEGICHGGMVVTLLDEVMGQVFAANKSGGLIREIPIMTGYLNTNFLKPVRTGTKERPRVVMVTARMVRRDGRKFWTEANVEGEDGEVMAKADALFIELKEAKL